jgi:amino acid permease
MFFALYRRCRILMGVPQLYNLSTITGLIAWSVILASYLRF